MLKLFFPNEPRKWLNERIDQFGIIILRSMFGLLWVSQAMVKLLERDHNDPNADFDGFLGQLYWMRDTHPYSFVSSIIDDLLIPNYEFFLILVIITELSIGISLGLGLMSRLGSLIGAGMSLSLWILTMGWDEWFWTYPLIFFPHILFFLSRSGKQIGIDRYLVSRYDNKLIEILS
ncbi:MAG: DoxX family protein [Candidatus Kariarchaeaceae archaeon]